MADSHEYLAKKREISGNTNNNINGEIDEEFYSRQLYVLGYDGMQRMVNSNVLISGMGGLGVEIAKNIILSGVKMVTIHDEQVCQCSDLSSQFYLSESDVGKNRADSCSIRLRELNNYVEIYVNTAQLTAEFIKQFHIVVLTNSSLQEQLWVSDITRGNDIVLIVADTKGLFGQVFCDFGESFTVDDCTGENSVSCRVANISKEEQGVVTCFCDIRHGFGDGDYVTFTEVEGMVELNDCEPKEIKVLDPYKFSIGDTTNYSDYTRGGIVTQVKVPRKLHYKALRESISKPEFVITDSAKPDHPFQLHLAFQALHEYIFRRGGLPEPWNQDQAADFVTLAKELNVNDRFKVEEINENLLEVFAKTSSGNLCPINAVIGGIAAQEVIKAAAGKFHPVHQWLYFDAIECLPEDRPALGEEKCKAVNSRYDSQIAVFGSDFQMKMGDLKYFVVGAGAIGCELLKNFSMMGVGAGTGHICVADMDTIEISNLNRQFLFRPWHIQKFKSHVAAQAAKEMNPDMKMYAFIDRVCNGMEDLYDDDFFDDLDGVANAVDNVKSRMYIDQRCVYYKKPLLESGTMGTKGNIQVIVPFLSESYASSVDPREEFKPCCNLKNIPNSIEDILSWARGILVSIFQKTFENAEMFIKDPLFLEKIRHVRNGSNKKLKALLNVKRVLESERPTNFTDCVTWARNHFEYQFRNQIMQILSHFPPDHIISSGKPFWSDPKRCPHPLTFSIDNQLHLDYIVAASNLLAKVYGIEQFTDRSQIAAVVNNVTVPPFVPDTVVYGEDDVGLPNISNDDYDNSSLETLINELHQLKRNLGGLKIVPIQFEMDDETNFHMDFIMAATNLRAENYGIPPADKFKSKQFAGKIIPAIATTSTVVAGLTCLELYKLAQSFQTLVPFKNGFINLAFPFFGFSEPLAAKKRKYYDVEWTIWDHFEVQGEVTLRQFLEYFRSKHKLEIIMLSYGCMFLFATFMPVVQRQEKMDLTLSQIIQTISRDHVNPNGHSLNLDIFCTDQEGKDVDVPYVRYVLQHKETI